MNLSKANTREIITGAVTGLVRELMIVNKDDLQLVSKAQAAGILDCDPQTLETLGIPRVMVGRAVKYRLADIRGFIQRALES